MASFDITRKDGRTFKVQVDDADLASVVEAGPWRTLVRVDRLHVKTVYVMRHHCGSNQYLHSFLMDAMGRPVDHINGDGLDNRRANLRLCTPAQNAANRSVLPRSKSRVKGVSWCKRDARWIAFIASEGKKKNLGRFDTIEAAKAAYDAAAKQLHGEFFRP